MGWRSFLFFYDQCKLSEIGTCNLNFGCMECLKDFLSCDSHCYLQSKDFLFTIVPQPKNSYFFLLWWLLVWLTGCVIAPLVVVFVDEMQTAISTRTTRIVVIMVRPQEGADSSSISPPAPRHCFTLVSNHSNQNWPITLSTQNQHFSLFNVYFFKRLWRRHQPHCELVIRVPDVRPLQIDWGQK